MSKIIWFPVMVFCLNLIMFGYILGNFATAELQREECMQFTEAHKWSSLTALCFLDRIKEPSLFVDGYNYCIELGGFIGIEYYDDNFVKGIECYYDASQNIGSESR